MRMFPVAVAGAVAVPVLAYSLYRATDVSATPRPPVDPDTLPKYGGDRKIFITDPKEPIEPPLAAVGVASQKYPNIVQLLERTSNLKGELPAVRVERDGQWKTMTWAQYRQDVHTFARGLLALGFQRYQSVAILGFNSPEWFVAFLGGIAAGGKGVGVYTTNGPEACKYVITHSEAHTIVLEDRKQLDKIIKVQSQLSLVKKIVVYNDTLPDAVRSSCTIPLSTWAEFMTEATSCSVDDAKVNSIIASVPSGQCCSLIYTSGTTGNPKAVMMSHDNLTFVVQSVLQLVTFLGRERDERVVSYLPLSHVAAQMLDIVMPIVASSYLPYNITVSFARPDALKGSLVHTLKKVRPSIFLGVPRVWEKMVEAMKEKAKETKGLKKKIAVLAKSVGLAAAEARQIGGSGRLPLTYNLFDKVLFSKIREAVGLDKCLFSFSGAAPITRDTLSFLGSLGIHVFEAFGMSESTGVATWSLPNCYRWGSVGFPIPGVEVSIDHVASRDKPGEGEIIFRGRNVMMGYMLDEQKTREAIDANGWLHSGDMGRVDEAGLVWITGRIKELIITAGGENIAPVPIEDELKRLMPAISNAMLVGDRRKYNVVLLTLKTKVHSDGNPTSELTGDSLAVSPGVTTVEQAQKDATWKEYIERSVKSYNTGTTCVSNAQKVQKFAILPTDFSIAGDELTATLKLKRNVVSAKYSDIIEGLYAGGGDA